MLVLTEAAAEVVKSVTDTPQAPDGTGLRITQSADEPSAANGLELAAAAEPGLGDQVVETSGARVFLDPLAAAGKLPIAHQLIHALDQILHSLRR